MPRFSGKCGKKERTEYDEEKFRKNLKEVIEGNLDYFLIQQNRLIAERKKIDDQLEENAQHMKHYRNLRKEYNL